MRRPEDPAERMEGVKGFPLPYTDETCELLKYLRMNYKDIIKVIIAIIEKRDPYTRGHSEKVTEIAVRIGHILGLPRERLEELKEASLLHDVGKIAIDERILRKPGPLTREEFAVIATHPDVGGRIVAQSRALKSLVPAIRHHHEMYGGGGYPNPSLKKERIPFFARIITLADSWDAMRSHRVYRPALSRREAIREIRKNIGKQFDPRLVPFLLKAI